MLMSEIQLKENKIVFLGYYLFIISAICSDKN